MKLFLIVALLCLGSYVQNTTWAESSNSKLEPVRIGWVGSITGKLSKWGAFNASKLAEEEINQAGGINGRPLEIIYEDAKSEGKEAVNAFSKLVSVDQVKFVIGGTCTPETMPIAPLAERHKVVLLAVITSNPYLTTAGDYVFRLTYRSIDAAEYLANIAAKQDQGKLFGVLYEESDYPRPQAEKFKEVLDKAGMTPARYALLKPPVQQSLYFLQSNH